MYEIMDTLYVWINSACLIFFKIRKNLVVTGHADMSVIGNEYTSDGWEDDARRW
jgi:hypothetical protein